jgi:hypothetical protein
MKATYEAPVFVIGGDVVRNTLTGSSVGLECDDPDQFNIKCPGSVGYYL